MVIIVRRVLKGYICGPFVVPCSQIPVSLLRQDLKQFRQVFRNAVFFRCKWSHLFLSLQFISEVSQGYSGGCLYFFCMMVTPSMKKP